jgi:hypothetical protein
MSTGLDRYEHGQWLAVCDRCGFEYKARQLSREWTGLRVCRGPDTNDCYETRHLQDSVRGRKDQQAPPWTRPKPADVFVDGYVWNDTTKAWEAS